MESYRATPHTICQIANPLFPHSRILVESGWTWNRHSFQAVPVPNPVLFWAYSSSGQCVDFTKECCLLYCPLEIFYRWRQVQAPKALSCYLLIP